MFSAMMDEKLKPIHERFDGMEKRFDNVDQKLEEIQTEMRSYFNRLEERDETLQSVVEALAYKTIVLEKSVKGIKKTLSNR